MFGILSRNDDGNDGDDGDGGDVGDGQDLPSTSAMAGAVSRGSEWLHRRSRAHVAPSTPRVKALSMDIFPTPLHDHIAPPTLFP